MGSSEDNKVRVGEVCCAADAIEERVNKACDAYFSQSFNPNDDLKAQLKRMGKKSDSVDWDKVKKHDTLYISSKFDVCEWWINVGKEKHPLFYIIVPAVLATPASNDFQERIFSCCTHFSNPLRQSLKDGRFEMAVLLAVNQRLLKQDTVSDEEVKEIIKVVVSKLEGETGLDPDSDDFV
jgi:hypothetical protein